MCNNENVIIARRTGEQRKESHSLKRELFVSRVFSTTQAEQPSLSSFQVFTGIRPDDGKSAAR
jgi:hypothetical protein